MAAIVGVVYTRKGIYTARGAFQLRVDIAIKSHTQRNYRLLYAYFLAVVVSYRDDAWLCC